MNFKRIRESVNLWLYDSKGKVLNTLNILKVIITLLGVAVSILLFGFDNNASTHVLLLDLLRITFGFYVFHFVVRLIYDFHPWQYIKSHWLEAIMVGFLIIEGINHQFFDTLLLERMALGVGIKNFEDIGAALIQLYFVAILLTDFMSEGVGWIPRFKIHPSVLFMISFLFLIFGGTGLLMLPEMTANPGSLNFIDSLFMSTSATCVTGLATVDVPADFTFKGHAVLLILVKLGGLNIIAFGYFIAIAGKFGIRVKQSDMLEDFMNKDSVLSARGMLRKVFIWSSTIEIIGAIALYAFYNPELSFESNGDKLFSSLFHSVSAFNNAGLSLFPDGIANPGLADNFFVHNTITLLVFFGALGFVAIFDLFDIKNLRERMVKPWKTIMFTTKIALYFSLILVAGGTLLFYLTEYNGVLKGMSFGEAMSHSLFQSVTRTSGFNSVDTGSLAIPTLIFMCFLMFVGSSSSSTGGGIKTSTFAIIWASMWAAIRGKRRAELFKRTISTDLILKALSVLLIFIAGNLVSIFLLSITEADLLAREGITIMDIIFEEVSAFGTVGLSTGITAELSSAGKTIIIFSMFVGRVGTLTFAYLLGREVLTRKYKYPDGHTMVG